jgi:hypothetical protein
MNEAEQMRSSRRPAGQSDGSGNLQRDGLQPERVPTLRRAAEDGRRRPLSLDDAHTILKAITTKQKDSLYERLRC